MIKKKDIKFLRFGDLSPIKQTGYKKDTFHSAPTAKGFYAFIDFMIEPFLLGGYNPIGTKHSKRKYVKDSEGNKIIIGRFYEDKNKPPIDEYDDYFEWVIFLTDEEQEKIEKRYSKQKSMFFNTDRNKNGFIYLHTMKKPKRFKYTGELWHHLTDFTPNNLVLKRSKEWILTDFNVFADALNKAIHDKRSSAHEWNWDYQKGDIPSKTLNGNKDDFEVFIERL